MREESEDDLKIRSVCVSLCRARFPLFGPKGGGGCYLGSFDIQWRSLLMGEEPGRLERSLKLAIQIKECAPSGGD